MAERAGFACSLLILALAFGGSAVRAEAAGFDCASARTAVEKAICGDAALSELDGMLAATFKTAYAGSDDKSALLAGQRFWLSRRAECVRSAGDDSVRAGVECLADRYRRRNAFLDRKTALEPANICHAMADAVTYAHGYVTMRPGYLNDKRILDLVALDTLGILNIHEPISERHIETHRAEGGVDINLIRKIKKLDTEDGAWSRHYYVLGSGRKRLAVSEFESGTLYCQTSSFYRFGEAGALGEVEVDRPDGCGEDLDYFADTPAGGPRVSPTIIHETPAITNVQIGAENWDGRSFVPLCLMTVTYDLTLRMNEASCEEKTGCDALSKQAMKLAREFETETGRQKWSPHGFPSRTHPISPMPRCLLTTTGITRRPDRPTASRTRRSQGMRRRSRRKGRSIFFGSRMASSAISLMTAMSWAFTIRATVTRRWQHSKFRRSGPVSTAA